MEGAWEWFDPPIAEKPISNEGGLYKRTFLLDPESCGMLVNDPEGEDEMLLQDSSRQYADMRLLRGLWEETGVSNSLNLSHSGSFFPLAAPDGAVLWGGAGMSSKQRQWRCAYRLYVPPTIPPCERAGRLVLDLAWLRAGATESELAEAAPSLAAAAKAMPNFGLMITLRPVIQPQQLMIPCARQLTEGESVCVLGFADHPSADWACQYLRTDEDHLQRAHEYRMQHNGEELPEDWELSSEEAWGRLFYLQPGVLFPWRLVAAPGRVAAASKRVIEHMCSTFPGMTGGPGVDIQTPWKLLFVHSHADADWRRGNYGCSVNHPLFFKAYVREVLPRLFATPSSLLTPDKIQCLLEYLEAHRGKLPDLSVLDKVKQLLPPPPLT